MKSPNFIQPHGSTLFNHTGALLSNTFLRQRRTKMINYENLVIGTLANDAFVMVNKKLAREIGFTEAGLLGEIIATYRYVKENYDFYIGGEEGPWFYLTVETVKERLGMSKDIQQTAVKNLVKSEVVKSKRTGLPATRHFLINWEKIVELLSKNDPEPAPQSDRGKAANWTEEKPPTGSRESRQLDGGNSAYFHTNKKDIQKRDIKTNIKKIDDDDRPSEENFEINNFAFKEFVKEFEAHMPNYYDNEAYNRIYQEMISQKVSFITVTEAIEQERKMNSRKETLPPIGDWFNYLVRGIKMNRTSETNAIAAEKFRKGLAEQKARVQQEKVNNSREPLPFYNWLDQD